jgi:hypothetical protein
MKQVTNNKKWFKKVRWSYLPSSWQGWLTYIPMLLFLVVVFVLIHHQNRAWIDTALLYVPYMISTGVIMHWLASHRS